MGYYTELKVKLKLKKDTPEGIINLLKRVLIEKDLGHVKTLFHSEDVFKPELEHEFFKAERWYMLFLSTNFGDIEGGKFYEENGYWIIDLHTEFKNYDSEIDKFMDWISLYVVGRKKKQYVGWWQGESMNEQINIYVERSL